MEISAYSNFLAKNTGELKPVSEFSYGGDLTVLTRKKTRKVLIREQKE